MNFLHTHAALCPPPLAALRDILRHHDDAETRSEQAHRCADAALLAYIDHLEVAGACEAVERWYASFFQL